MRIRVPSEGDVGGAPTPRKDSVASVMIALSVNLLGDWLRDALNPRLR